MSMRNLPGVVVAAAILSGVVHGQGQWNVPEIGRAHV